ncbi:a8775383-721e-4d89-8dd5-ab8d4ea2133b [Thermothielavioides terrestris]
MSIGY